MKETNSEQLHEVHIISEMSPKEIATFAHSMRFRTVDTPPSYVQDRLDTLTFDKHPEDKIFWHVMTSVPAAVLRRTAELSSVNLYVAQQVNSRGESVSAHFIEDSGQLSGFSQIFFGNGGSGHKSGEPYVFWNHTDDSFAGQGRGLLRTILMGEYAKIELRGKSLDAGTMVHVGKSEGKHKDEVKAGNQKDFSHSLHIWDTLVAAELAEKIDETHYRYITSRA